MHRWPHLVFYIALALVSNGPAAADSDDAPLQLKRTISLPGVVGRIDHFDLDPEGERLFVCALGNNTVEVIDLRKGERIHSISGLGAPQGIAYVPELNHLLIANDKGGLCNIYDANSWQLLGKVDFQDDADNARYDSVTQQIFVGFGSGGIGVISAPESKRVGMIKLAAHPEAFEVEKHGRRIFVNVPNAGHVAVIDRDKGEVIARWKTDGATANFPMALDEASRRLFIACRNPAKLLVLNSDSGAVVTTLDISGDPDEVFYDAKRRRLYVVCGAGFVEIMEQADADHYRRAAKIPTASGARTGFFEPERNALFIAAPQRGGQAAEIREYEVR